MIVAFVYDFAHFKSAQGLLQLKMMGCQDVVAVAAPWKPLPFTPSVYQFSTPAIDDTDHPAEVAAALGMHYLRAEHDDDRARRLLQSAEMGIVLGARVLKPAIVEAGAPILNLHPGVLPLNRGLDTLKWAVHAGLPQGVAAHVIDRRIDRGELLFQEVVDVRPDDTPGEITTRLMWRQIRMLPDAVRAVRARRDRRERVMVGAGVYRKAMTRTEDEETRERFETWRENYAEFCAAWLSHGDLGHEAHA